MSFNKYHDYQFFDKKKKRKKKYYVKLSRALHGLSTSIYIKTENVAECLPFGMYDNDFCMTHDS